MVNDFLIPFSIDTSRYDSYLSDGTHGIEKGLKENLQELLD